MSQSDQCSIGIFLSEACDERKYDARLWTEVNQTLLLERIYEKANKQPHNITTCCLLHYKYFFTRHTKFETSLVAKDFSYSQIMESYKILRDDHSAPLMENLRFHQAKALHKLLLGMDVLVVIPTNSGKSFIMALPSLMKFRLLGQKEICLIVMPLNRLLVEMVSRLTSWGLYGFVLSTDMIRNSELLQKISEGQPVFILSSPETLEKEESKQFLRSIKVTGIFVDEVHTTHIWGEDFRPAFTNLVELRSFIDCPVGVLTATFCTPMLKSVAVKIGLSIANMEIISASPDRPEIFLNLRKKSGDIEKDFECLIQDLNNKGPLAEKTIVFVKSAVHASYLNIEFRQSLKNSGEHRVDGILDEYYTEHYSSNLDLETSERICSSFANPNNCLRVLFTTEAYGMGMDNKTLRHCIIYDADNDPVSVLQKIGRVARDGKPGNATIFSSKSYSDKKIYQKGKCVRESLLRSLIGYEEFREQRERDFKKSCICGNNNCECWKCKCCINCSLTCTCKSFKDLEPEDEVSEDSEEEFLERESSEESSGDEQIPENSGSESESCVL